MFASAAAGHPEPGRVGPGSVSSPYSMQALALTWGRPGSAGKTVGALLSLRRRGGEVAKQSRVLQLSVATKLLNNLVRALGGDFDHGPHRVRQRHARHI